MLSSKVLPSCQNEAQALRGQALALWECSVAGTPGVIRAVGRACRAAGSGYPRGSSPGSATAVPPSQGPLESPSYAQVFHLHSHFLILSVSNFALIIFLCLFRGWKLAFALCNSVAWKNPTDVVLIVSTLATTLLYCHAECGQTVGQLTFRGPFQLKQCMSLSLRIYPGLL